MPSHGGVGGGMRVMMNQDYLGFLAAAFGLRLFSIRTTSGCFGALLMSMVSLWGVWSFASLLEHHRLTKYLRR
jgi:hypothetical protein